MFADVRGEEIKANRHNRHNCQNGGDKNLKECLFIGGGDKKNFNRHNRQNTTTTICIRCTRIMLIKLLMLIQAYGLKLQNIY